MLLVTDSSLCLQVNYLQNDNALLENKQKELKGTIQSLVQSRESFINAYEVCIFLTFLRPHAGCCFILLEDKRMKMGRLVKKWYNTSWTPSKEVGYRDRIPKVSMKRGVAISVMYKELTLWSIWSPASRHLKQLKLMKAIAEYTKRLWIWAVKVLGEWLSWDDFLWLPSALKCVIIGSFDVQTASLPYVVHSLDTLTLQIWSWSYFWIPWKIDK